MDIKNIKGPGAFPGVPTDASTDPAANAKPESPFADVAAETAAKAAEGSRSVNKVQRAELDDPAKLDSLVRACVSELIDAGQNQVGQISAADKQSLTDFLSTDPHLRQQIESYLRKVAS